MAINIINHDRVLKAPRPEIITFEVCDPDGNRCLAASATGLVPMSLQGRSHSYTHNIELDIDLPFAPASQVVSLAARGQELRGLARFGFRRVGWSIVDFTSQPEARAVRVNMSLWVNNGSAWSLGIIYNCTALSAPLNTV